jgi:hypothetical protein
LLIQALGCRETPGRARVLEYLCKRWLEAPLYGGDPLVTGPPGGTDIPTPLLADGAPPVPSGHGGAQQAGQQEFDIGSHRRMDLCAWQTGRAIRARSPALERLLDDPDGEVRAAAAVLLQWRDTRSSARQALVQTASAEPHPQQQARRILELGVYATVQDRPLLSAWAAPRATRRASPSCLIRSCTRSSVLDCRQSTAVLVDLHIRAPSVAPHKGGLNA